MGLFDELTPNKRRLMNSSHPTKNGASPPLGLFTCLWFVSLLLPLVVADQSPPAGIVAGVALPILWVTQSPSACFQNVVVALPMGVVQITSAIVWLAIGIRVSL